MITAPASRSESTRSPKAPGVDGDSADGRPWRVVAEGPPPPAPSRAPGPTRRQPSFRVLLGFLFLVNWPIAVWFLRPRPVPEVSYTFFRDQVEALRVGGTREAVPSAVGGLGAGCGIAVALLLVVDLATLASSPEVGAPAQEIAAHLAGNSTPWR